MARYFDDNARCADLLNGYVFHGDQVIAAEDVQEVDSRVTGIEINPVENEIKYTQQFRDFVRKTIFGVGCVIVEIENQERIHYAMPIRVLSEEAKEYERQMKKIQKKHEMQKNLKKFVESNEERLDNMARDACELIAVVTDTPEFAFRDKAYETGEGNVKMCQGMKEWLEEKYEEGHAEERVRSIANIMQNLNLSLEDACRGLGISVEEYNKAKAMIAR